MKTLKKVVLSLLALALVLIPANLISAQGIAIDGDTLNPVTELETVVWNDASKEPTYKAYGVQLTLDGTNKTEYVIPLKVPNKGLLYVGRKLPEEAASLYSAVELYSDASCTKNIYVSSTEGYAKIDKAGTYYIKISVSDYREQPEGTYTFGFSSCLVSGENVTLKNNKEVVSAVTDYSKPVYYKVKVNKAGKLKFVTSGDGTNYVTLCNSSKKAITDEISSTSVNSKFEFSVGKGTYYVKVKSYADVITVRSTVSAVKDASGASKAKATKLSINSKAKNGLVLSSDKNKKADWFKFYNNKNQKISINIEGKVLSGEVRVELYYANGKKFANDYTRLNQYRQNASFSPYVARLGATSGKLPKGTYYIKLTKAEKNTNGSYTIKVKNK